jgi:DNA-binding IclR family transcriptional regulator
MPTDAKHPVATSRKTIRILDELRALGGARVTDLAESLDMNKSTVHNHLSTLLAEELVVRDGPRYELGLRLLEYGGHARNRHRLYRVAVPEVERLAERTGELANLMVEEYGRGVYLCCERGDQAVDLDTYPGLRRPLHATGVGKAILAHLPDERVDDIVDRHGLTAETAATVTDRSTLDDQLSTVRDRGFAVDDEELIPGLRCVGVPILDSDGAVLGAISVSQPTNRMDDDRFLDDIPDVVRSAANVIELNVNHS